MTIATQMAGEAFGGYLGTGQSLGDPSWRALQPSARSFAGVGGRLPTHYIACPGSQTHSIGRPGSSHLRRPLEPGEARLRGLADLRPRNNRLWLDAPLKDRHATPPLAWQRYPHIDGYIEPWTATGKLRAGLSFSRRGDVAACSDGPGYATFGRWRITGRSW